MLRITRSFYISENKKSRPLKTSNRKTTDEKEVREKTVRISE